MDDVRRALIKVEGNNIISNNSISYNIISNNNISNNFIKNSHSNDNHHKDEGSTCTNKHGKTETAIVACQRSNRGSEVKHKELARDYQSPSTT